MTYSMQILELMRMIYLETLMETLTFSILLMEMIHQRLIFLMTSMMLKQMKKRKRVRTRLNHKTLLNRHHKVLLNPLQEGNLLVIKLQDRHVVLHLPTLGLYKLPKISHY